MSERPPVSISAPWDDYRVWEINAYQLLDTVHPLTCGHDSSHDNLVAERLRLRCPNCDYEQTWVPTAIISLLYSMRIVAQTGMTASAHDATVRRAALEEAEAACESFVGDTDGSAFADGQSIARQQIAERIRALADDARTAE